MTPAIYNTPNPAGFDLKVLDFQNQLANLNFIEGIFGVAKVQLELRTNSQTEDTYLLQDMGKKGTTKHERWYPQAQKLGGLVDLSIDDSYSSRLFFLVKDPISTSPKEDEWNWGDANVELKQPFSIIFHCDMRKIANLGLGLDSTEKVKLSILYALSQCPKLTVESQSENMENVWKEFTLTPEINGFAIYPFYALRLDCYTFYYAFPNNGSLIDYDPSVNFTPQTSIPNSNVGYANVN